MRHFYLKSANRRLQNRHLKLVVGSVHEMVAANKDKQDVRDRTSPLHSMATERSTCFGQKRCRRNDWRRRQLPWRVSHALERHLNGKKTAHVLIKAVNKEASESAERRTRNGPKKRVNPLHPRGPLRLGVSRLFIDVLLGNQVSCAIGHAQNSFGHNVIRLVLLFFDQTLQFDLNLGHRIDGINGIDLAVRRKTTINLMLRYWHQSNLSITCEPLLHRSNRRSREMIPIGNNGFAIRQITLLCSSIGQNDI